MLSVRGFLKEYGIAIGLIALTLPMIPLSGLGPAYIAQELITRLGRNAILVLALLPMLYAGMGFNFALGAGAIGAQIGLILAVAFNFVGPPGLAFAVLAGFPIAVLFGWITGRVMNRAKGYEMLAGFFLMPFFSGLYVRSMLYLPNSWFPGIPTDTFLTRGYGLGNIIKFYSFLQSLDKWLPLRLGPLTLPIGTYLAVAAVALLILWVLKTQLGQNICAVGSDSQAAEDAGISVDRTRLIAVILSMVLACLGQVVYFQSMGIMVTYGAHKLTTFLAVPALIAGGASLRKAQVRHVFIGIPVLHAFLLLSPDVFQKLSGHTQLDEYVQPFVVYALIAIALIRYGMEKHRQAEQARKEEEAPAAAEPTPQ